MYQAKNSSKVIFDFSPQVTNSVSREQRQNLSGSREKPAAQDRIQPLGNAVSFLQRTHWGMLGPEPRDPPMHWPSRLTGAQMWLGSVTLFWGCFLSQTTAPAAVRVEGGGMESCPPPDVHFHQMLPLCCLRFPHQPPTL